MTKVITSALRVCFVNSITQKLIDVFSSNFHTCWHMLKYELIKKVWDANVTIAYFKATLKYMGSAEVCALSNECNSLVINMFNWHAPWYVSVWFCLMIMFGSRKKFWDKILPEAISYSWRMSKHNIVPKIVFHIFPSSKPHWCTHTF